MIQDVSFLTLKPENDSALENLKYPAQMALSYLKYQDLMIMNDVGKGTCLGLELIGLIISNQKHTSLGSYMFVMAGICGVCVLRANHLKKTRQQVEKEIKILTFNVLTNKYSQTEWALFDDNFYSYLQIGNIKSYLPGAVMQAT